jgi:tetratricopeptide (TPR) repeat protein
MRRVATDEMNGVDLDPPVTFEADGLTYSVERDGARVIHAERRFDEQGNLVHEKSEPVAYVVGAGSHGRSYLIQRDNSLWMSPITWYPQQNRWALSPNYENGNHHFTRAILPDCLFCHANRAHHLPFTVNRYETPIFTGLMVGCERCHGPGELHIDRQTHGDVPAVSHDDSIVNPRNLSPELRDGVCQQCHLAGAVRVVRRGRDRYDFRPGLPFEEFVAAFVKPTHAGELAAVTSHEEQMRVSRCYVASGLKMGCISCHDPHAKPQPEEAASIYRKRCLACHQEANCHVGEAARIATDPADNCISCHMPAISSNIQHAAMTDHRIPRHMHKSLPESRRRPANDWPLVPLPGNSIDPQSPDARRDLAVALMMFATKHADQVSEQDLLAVTPILANAVERDPQDFDAVEALAHVLYIRNQLGEALATVTAGIKRSPNHEQMLDAGMLIAARSLQWDLAGKYADRLTELNPHHSRYWQMGARIAFTQGDLNTATNACNAVLELDPADQQTRRLLVRLLRAQNRTAEETKQADILRCSAPFSQRDSGAR